MITTGDLIRYRRVQVRPERAGTDKPAYDLVDDLGIVLESRGFPCASGTDYLVRVFFANRPDSPIRTIRASKIAEVLDSPVQALVVENTWPIGGVDDLIPF